eukprot:gene7854-8704_t
MGCPISVSIRKTEPFQNAMMINSIHATNDRNRTKVIVLGTSNSGKSTLLRQFQIINTSGFSTAEREAYVPIIVNNIVKAVDLILRKAVEAEIAFVDERVVGAAEEFLQLYSEESSMNTNITSKLLALVLIIWQDNRIKEIFNECKDEFENGDTLACLFEDIARISRAGYLPSNQDILHCRMRSTGIKTLHFDFDDIPLELIDVGGQRSERRKWIHYFDDVEVVLFCVSANEYNMALREDPGKNAMQESLEMFKSIINSTWFMNKPIILFLNKTDLLEHKFKRFCIKQYFSDFTGNSTQYADVSNFIKAKFLQCNRYTKREIYAFNTCATDTSNIDRISKICFHMVFKRTLTDMGL